VITCPLCGHNSTVTETRGSFRDRQCLDPNCPQRPFTTNEEILPNRRRSNSATVRNDRTKIKKSPTFAPSKKP